MSIAPKRFRNNRADNCSEIEHLDPTVQDALDNFISERGINESLANFVLQYCEHKEQKVRYCS